MKTGRIHSVESLGTLDGPGVRTVFFMQGCHMKCLYCHNRDSWPFNGGKVMSLEEILHCVESYRDYYGSTGGVTFSGGEPLLQSEFLADVVKALKKRDIHTALDTSGSVYSEKTRELLDLVDLVILDIKHSRKDLFKTLCSYDIDSTLHVLSHLQSGTTNYWIRQVIVEKFTTSMEQIELLKSMIFKGKYPERVELIPYHDMGKEKWSALEETYPLEGTLPPSGELLSQLKIRLNNSSTESRK